MSEYRAYNFQTAENHTVWWKLLCWISKKWKSKDPDSEILLWQILLSEEAPHASLLHIIKFKMRRKIWKNSIHSVFSLSYEKSQTPWRFWDLSTNWLTFWFLDGNQKKEIWRASQRGVSTGNTWRRSHELRISFLALHPLPRSVHAVVTCPSLNHPCFPSFYPPPESPPWVITYLQPLPPSPGPPGHRCPRHVDIFFLPSHFFWHRVLLLYLLMVFCCNNFFF